MNLLRGIAFNIAFYGGSFLFGIGLQWIRFVKKREDAQRYIKNSYFTYVDWCERKILNLQLEMRGLENLPKDGAYIIAAKHQSAYETIKLALVIDDPAIVLKEELTKIPLWGWYTVKIGMISIDRGSALQAMRSIIRGAERVKKEGRPIIIFPQGTRVPPGERRPYRMGLAKLYKEAELPIVPLALNSGVFWGKNSFIKKPGTVVFEFLPPIPPGRKPTDAMKELQEVLEERSDKLVIEAGGPALPPPEKHGKVVMPEEDTTKETSKA